MSDPHWLWCRCRCSSRADNTIADQGEGDLGGLIDIVLHYKETAINTYDQPFLHRFCWIKQVCIMMVTHLHYASGALITQLGPGHPVHYTNVRHHCTHWEKTLNWLSRRRMIWVKPHPPSLFPLSLHLLLFSPFGDKKITHENNRLESGEWADMLWRKSRTSGWQSKHVIFFFNYVRFSYTFTWSNVLCFIK